MNYNSFNIQLLEYSKTYKGRLLAFPIFGEDTKTSEIDEHYFYMGNWAFKKIVLSGVKEHIDVASQLQWIGLLSQLVKVTFIDIRPPKILGEENIEIMEGSILRLPFADGSVKSLSCLHVLEHIGLGRYGDTLDVDGTKKACKELARILAKGGNLYIVLPVGDEVTCFNAHKILSPSTVIDYFKDLKLVEFSASNCETGKGLVRNADLVKVSKSSYACGMFHFTKL